MERGEEEEEEGGIDVHEEGQQKQIGGKKTLKNNESAICLT